MRRLVDLLTVAALVGVLPAGCESEEDGCPVVTVAVEDDTYTAGAAVAATSFPHPAGATPTIIVDRASNSVVITYERGGQTVTETWDIVATGVRR